jgi:hypothetical protein
VSEPGDQADRADRADRSQPTDLPPIGAPATRALVAAGYSSLHQLDGVPRRELAALHGVGPKALRILQDALEQQSMTLG